MAEQEIDYANEFLWLWKECVELSKKMPDNEQIQRQAQRAQMNYVRSLALQSD